MNGKTMLGKTLTLAQAAPGRRRVQVVMIGMLMTLLAAISLSAFAQPHGMGGGMGGMMFGASPERAGRMLDHLLDGLDASDAQRSQIKQIAAAAMIDMKAQMQAGRSLRQRGMELFTAPTIDAAAAEQLRQQTLQQHEQASRRMTQAMVDVARVLTPEQRAKIGARMKDRQARMDERTKRMEGTPPPR